LAGAGLHVGLILVSGCFDAHSAYVFLACCRAVNRAQHTIKWCPTYYEMAPDQSENGDQCCFNKFDCRLFISKFSHFAIHLSLYLSVASEGL